MDIDLTTLKEVKFNNQDVLTLKYETLTGDIDIWTKPASEDVGWKTIFTGNLSITNYAINTSFVKKEVTITGLKANVPTRVTGTGAYSKTPFTNVELTKTFSTILTSGDTVVVDAGKNQQLYKPTIDNKLIAKIGGVGLKTVGIIITKIEQYY